MTFGFRGRRQSCANLLASLDVLLAFARLAAAAPPSFTSSAAQFNQAGPASHSFEHEYSTTASTSSYCRPLFGAPDGGEAFNITMQSLISNFTA